MPSDSGYTRKAREAEALAKATIRVLKELPLTRREEVLTELCADPVVERALTEAVEKAGVEVPRKFSPLAKGIDNFSSFAATSGELTSPGTPSEIAKRRARSRR
jgi:hypothetical protein